MKSNFIRLFITFYILAATSAEFVRTRRDLARIQNVIKWLLGINERKLIRTVPFIANEQQRVYTIPTHANILFRASPQMDINQNIGNIFSQVKPYMPAVAIPNNYPLVYNNNPPAIQEYSRIKDRDYAYGIPVYNTNRLPMHQKSINPLCPISITNIEECGYDTRAIIAETSQPLPQPPTYIQNRMHQIIFDHPIPSINMQQDIVTPPPGLRKVAYMNMINEANPTQTPVKIEEEQLNPILSVALKPEANYALTKKTVTFTEPVHSKYKYKMIYHNQPQKNTVVEMDSTQSQAAKPKEEDSVIESTDQVNNLAPISVLPNNVPANYVHVPPVSTEVPPPSMLKVNTNIDNYSAAASENRPIVALDDSTLSDAAGKDRPTKVIIRRRKLKSRPETSRGDIPEISSQIV